MKKSLLAAGIVALGVAGWAYAQPVNVVPQVGMISSIVKNPTFTAWSGGLVPASSATDVFCLNGSTSKTVHVTRWWVTGTAGTLITVPVYIKLNHSLDSGGTAYTLAAGTPFPSPNALNGSDVSTAAVTAYSANPTINDTAPIIMWGGNATFGTAAAMTGVNPFAPLFGAQVDLFDKGMDIAPAATVVKQFCVNLSATSPSSGLLQVGVEWTEQ